MSVFENRIMFGSGQMIFPGAIRFGNRKYSVRAIPYGRPEARHSI